MKFNSIMSKTIGSCFYIVIVYFPCHFVNAFGLAVLFYRPSSFEGMVYQQIVGIPMGTNCAPLIADLFLFFMKWILCLTFTNRNGTTL